MARRAVNPPARGWSLALRPRDWARLESHLHADGEEHGAIVLAEVVPGLGGKRLLGRKLLLARDGIDYVVTPAGHHSLSANFVRDAAVMARREGLAYLAFHNHGGGDHVAFSRVDLDSHERGYPSIRQLTGGLVGAVVCTPQAAAGDLWLADGTRSPLDELVVPGDQLLRLREKPTVVGGIHPSQDRQARVFGSTGQLCLRGMRVAVVGLGGVGQVLSQHLSRLGVGELLLIDSDTVDVTNLPRLPGSRSRDVGTAKVQLARRVAREASPRPRVITMRVPVQDPEALRQLSLCDWIFLAADSHAARHWVNGVVESYLIPASQIGVKVPVDERGNVGRIHTVVRRMTPGGGCLWCNGLIKPTELAIDMGDDQERRQAQYVEGVPAPSVITLNGIAAAHATTDFMLSVTHLSGPHATDHMYEFVEDRTNHRVRPRRDPDCGWCGDNDAVGERMGLAARMRMPSVAGETSIRSWAIERLRRLRHRTP